MADDAEVTAARSDLSYLKNVLGIASEKSSDFNSPCPLCGGKHSLQWGPDKKRLGQWYWNCNKCNKGGDILSALKETTGHEWRDIYKRIRADFKGRVPQQSAHDTYHANNAAQHNGTLNGHVKLLPAPDPEIKFSADRPEPSLDMARAEAYVQEQHEYLLRNPHIPSKWKRGISDEVIRKYRLGFVEFGEMKFYPWSKSGLAIPAAWVLPITDADGVLKGVKLHFEERPHYNDGECPKCMWLPFGMKPGYERHQLPDGKWVVDSKPIHNHYCLWPHPSTLLPRVINDFSMDWEWYVSRMPDKLRQKWADQLLGAKYMVALELSKTEDDLDASEVGRACEKAFETMKKEIMSAVCGAEEKKVKTTGEDWSNFTFICAGELKALAAESCGLMACAPTSGEGNWLAPAHLLSKFAGQQMCVFGDEDPPHRVFKSDKEGNKTFLKTNCTGMDFCSKWSAALYAVGAARVITKLGGHRGK